MSSAHRAVANRVESSGASGIGPDGINVCGEVSSATERLRGNLVEIIFSPASRKAAKPLKKMVGTTGIEPVTRDDLPIGIGVFGRCRIALMAAVMLVMP